MAEIGIVVGDCYVRLLTRWYCGTTSSACIAVFQFPAAASDGLLGFVSKTNPSAVIRVCCGRRAELSAQGERWRAAPMGR